MTGSYPIRRGAMWAFVAFVFVLLFGFGALAVASSGAVAQEQPDDPTEQNETTPEEELTPEEEIEDQLGDLVIHSYDYDDSTETMTIEASWQGRAPTRATFVEMIELDSGGSTEISFQRVRLRPDERTEITVSATTRTGGTAAVMVTTPESISNGNALILQDGDPDEYPAINFSNVLLAIGLTSIGSVGVAFIGVLRLKHKRKTGVDRIA
ncbi:hypothetical protein BRC87_00475 [Halobacteriales archaeon QS_4_66_20]|nr:MAG: hypothetical protein BRC87_00475 [Halobacteriales archaeon QS_4_66_20]